MQPLTFLSFSILCLILAGSEENLLNIQHTGTAEPFRIALAEPVAYTNLATQWWGRTGTVRTDKVRFYGDPIDAILLMGTPLAETVSFHPHHKRWALTGTLRWDSTGTPLCELIDGGILLLIRYLYQFTAWITSQRWALTGACCNSSGSFAPF